MNNSLKYPILIILAFFVTTGQSFARWEESLNLKFDNQKWANVGTEKDEWGWYMVFVPEGQSRNNWTERFIYHYTEAPNALTPKEFYDLCIADVKNGKEFSSHIIEQDKESILFELSVLKARGIPDFFEIQRFVLGKKAFHSIKYTIKTSNFPLEKQTQWIKLLENATVNYREEP